MMLCPKVKQVNINARSGQLSVEQEQLVIAILFFRHVHEIHLQDSEVETKGHFAPS